jgi:N4-gp56 family major capsid protein
MAVQTFSTSHPLSQQQWSEGLEAEVLKKISYVNYVGKRSDALIQWKDELADAPGDTITFGLRMQLTADLLGSSDTFETNEQTLTIHNDSVVIDELGHAVRWKTKMDKQRVAFNMLDEARAGLADQLAHGLDTGFFNQVGGYTPSNSGAATMTWNNTVLAPSSGRQIWAGTPTDDESLASTDVFTLPLLDKAIELAKTSTPAFRPARIEGLGEYYVCFLHPYQVTSLRDADSDWTAINRDILRGGGINNNPILTGALGTYNGVLLVENTRVTQGVDSGTPSLAVTDVRRAPLCGAQAAVLGWGRLGGSPSRFVWAEETFDFGREHGVAASSLVGGKKTQFNSTDFGVIVISTFATAAT